jgi:hypothetical protein
MQSIFRKTLTSLVVAGALLMTGAASAVADDHHCDERVRKAEENLNREVAKHGEHSPKADKLRAERDRVRHECHMDEHPDHPDHP